MEDVPKVYTDILLFRVFNCCSLDWQYLFPSKSFECQRVFDLEHGERVVNALRIFQAPRSMLMLRHFPVLSTLNKETFYSAIQIFKAGAFNSANKRFLLMVFVAFLAVFFVKSGKREARLWAFEIISLYASL